MIFILKPAAQSAQMLRQLRCQLARAAKSCGVAGLINEYGQRSANGSGANHAVDAEKGPLAAAPAAAGA